MDYIHNTLSNAYNDAYNCVADQASYVSDTISTKVNSVYKATMDAMQLACDTVTSSVTYAKDSTLKALNDTKKAIEDFINENSQELLFVGATLVTLGLSSSVAVPVFFVSIFVRLEIDRRLKELADKYLKNENNPYQSTDKYKVVSDFDFSIGVIAAIDSVALSTLFSSSLVLVNLFPLFGAIVAGSCAAKLIMNMMSEENPQASESENVNPSAPEYRNEMANQEKSIEGQVLETRSEIPNHNQTEGMTTENYSNHRMCNMLA